MFLDTEILCWGLGVQFFVHLVKATILGQILLYDLIFGFGTNFEAMNAAEFERPLVHFPNVFPGHRVDHGIVCISSR